MAFLTIETQRLANTKPFTFCFYVSGHGWGHATRANQIITDILRLPAGHTVYVVSNATDFIFQGVIKIGAIYRHSLIDAGVVQPLAYTVDRDETISQLKTFLERRPETIEKEVKWLKEIGADCVICDAPFLPCAAAEAAGIPAALASNFTFDEVYEGLCEGDALDEEIRKLNSQVIDDYKNADLLVRLPGAIRIPSFDDSDELVPITPVTSSFPDRKGVVNGKHSLPSVSASNVRSHDSRRYDRHIIDVPLVFRKFRRPRDEVLAGLNIPKDIRDTHKVLVLSFGGQILGKEGWGDPLPPNWICIVCCASDAAKLPPKFYKATRDAYVPDLTNAADVLLGKLGYGTCSECIGHGTPFVYVPRPQFIEEMGLLKLMKNQGSAVELPREDFEQGRWASYISEAAELPGRCEPERVVGHNGGEVAARALENFVIDRKRIGRRGDIPSTIVE
ncbi:unnamed protein product [Umbelopsis sp. WA50703]